MKKLKSIFSLLVVLVVALSFAVPSFAARPKPSLQTVVPAWDQFRNSGTFSGQFVCDRPRVWIPAHENSLTATGIVSMGTGTAVPTEVNTSEAGGYLFDADNESHSILFPLPADIDLAKIIRVRVLWSNSEAAATGSAQFDLSYTAITQGTTAIAVAATTTGITAGADQADLAANVMQWSNWASIAASTFSGVPGDDLILFKVAVDLTTIANATYYGIQIEYYRQALGCD